MIIFLNGQFAEENKATISISDRGLTLADGVFDTLLVINGNLQYGQQHFTRLRKHADVIRISIKHDTEELEQIADKLLKENNFKDGAYALRTTITRGIGGRGLTLPEHSKPTIIMKATPVTIESSPPPVNAMIARNVKRNENSPLSRIKSLNYGDNLIALMEAQDKGFDDAIMLNSAGNITCTTTGNIFIREGESMITPPLSDGVMDGITRQVIIEEKGAKQESISEDRLIYADEVLITNSIRGIRTVSRSSIENKSAA